MQKIQVTQDHLLQFIREHGVKMAALERLTGISHGQLAVYFNRSTNNYGQNYRFSAQAIAKVNAALPQLAEDIRQRFLSFGSPEVFTNRMGRTYDPAVVPQMKALGTLINIPHLTDELLGWAKPRRMATFSASSKIYGNITQDDVTRINIELQQIAAALESFELVADADSSDSSSSD